MKLSKKEEAAILQVYKTYFDSYVGGDIETITSLLAEDYTQIGSAEAEVFFNKKEAIQFLHSNSLKDFISKRKNFQVQNFLMKITC